MCFQGWSFGSAQTTGVFFPREEDLHCFSHFLVVYSPWCRMEALWPFPQFTLISSLVSSLFCSPLDSYVGRTLWVQLGNILWQQTPWPFGPCNRFTPLLVSCFIKNYLLMILSLSIYIYVIVLVHIFLCVSIYDWPWRLERVGVRSLEIVTGSYELLCTTSGLSASSLRSEQQALTLNFEIIEYFLSAFWTVLSGIHALIDVYPKYKHSDTFSILWSLGSTPSCPSCFFLKLPFLQSSNITCCSLWTAQPSQSSLYVHALGHIKLCMDWMHDQLTACNSISWDFPLVLYSSVPPDKT